MGKQWKQCQTLFLGAPKSLQIVIAVFNLKMLTPWKESYDQPRYHFKKQKEMFFWNSLAFSMIQWMLAFWSLVPLPFLKPAWTSGSSLFMYCWSPSDITSLFLSYQIRSVAQSCLTVCDRMNCSTPGLPVHHHLPEFTQTHVHRVSDAIQPSHPLSSPSPLAPNPSQHQSLFQWVTSSHEVANILEFQL